MMLMLMMLLVGPSLARESNEAGRGTGRELELPVDSVWYVSGGWNGVRAVAAWEWGS